MRPRGWTLRRQLSRSTSAMFYKNREKRNRQERHGKELCGWHFRRQILRGSRISWLVANDATLFCDCRVKVSGLKFFYRFTGKIGKIRLRPAFQQDGVT